MLSALWGVLTSPGPPATTSESNVLTEPEKNTTIPPTDTTGNADPCEAFVRGLADRSDPARKDIVCTLCDELYGWKSVDQPSDKLMAKLLLLCHGDPTILSKMLQTPFMDNQTPLQWVFARLSDEFFSGSRVMKSTPPIVGALLAASNPPPLAIDSLVQACCDRDGDALYQSFNQQRLFSRCNSSYRVTRPSAVSNAQSKGSDQANLGNYTHFEIPHFPERMLLDGYVDLRFIRQRILWSIRLETTNYKSKWTGKVAMVQLSSTLDSDPAWKRLPSIRVTLFIKDTGVGYSRQIDRLSVSRRVGSYASVPVDGEAISKMVSDDRKLIGQVHIWAI